MSTKSFTFVLLAIMCVVALATARMSPRSSYYTAAALADEIIDLPDAPQWYNKQFSGYLDVFNATTDMFYWFVEAKNDPANAPVLFWTSGGPGCSGMIGKLTEMGPYQPVSDGKGGAKLQLRPTTWNEDFNIFYVEQPDVGFTNVKSNKPQVWTDDETAKRNADAIRSFFLKFPQYRKNPFGISSESYGGHYIPWLNRELLTQINAGTLELNYKWSIVGNPLIYLPMDDFSAFKTMIQRQIIPSWPIGEQYIATCQPDVHDFSNPPKPRPAVCDTLESQMSRYTHLIDPYAMSFPICVDASGKLQASGHGYGEHIRKMMGRAQKSYGKRFTYLEVMELHQSLYDFHAAQKNLQNGNKATLSHPDPVVNALLQDIVGKSNEDYFPENYQQCEEEFTTLYLNRKDVQRALHANMLRPTGWSMCEDIPYDNRDFIDSTLPVFKENSIIGPKVKQLIFSGTDDSVCSTNEAQMALFNNFKVNSVWEEVTLHGQNVGFKTTFKDPENITFVTVSGAGHMCPATRPQHTYQLIKRFIQGKL